mgnify:CR=1 FL=1
MPRLTPERPPKQPASPRQALEMARPRRGEVAKLKLTPEEDKRIKELLAQAKRAEDEDRMQDALELYLRVKAQVLEIKAKTHESSSAILDKEGKEIVNMENLRTDWIKFYNDHGLEDLANALPKSIKLSPEAVSRLREAAEQGFDQVILLPSPEIQNQSFDPLINLTKYPGENEPYIWNKEEAKQAIQDPENLKLRPEQGKKAYLLLYQSNPVPQETKGKTFAAAKQELDKLFGEGKWNGLTLQEYLILQRQEFEANKDHSFDEYSVSAEQSQWTWLLDSRAPSGCVDASWHPGDRRVGLGWGEPGISRPRLGARPAVVVEIL